MKLPPIRAVVVPSVLLLGLLVVGALRPVFMSLENVRNILLQGSILAMVACGMTLVIVAGNIDLSVGSVMALAGIVLGMMVRSGWPSHLGVVVAVSIGAICGALSGMTIAFLRLPAFVVTLGMMGIARGAALALSDGRPVVEVGRAAELLGGAYLAWFPVPVVLLAIATIGLHVLLRHTAYGVQVFAYGGSRKAAWVSGIGTGRVVVSTHAICGAMAAVAGVVLAGRLGSAQPNAGTGYELDAITAAVLGGGALVGGGGSMLGTVLAVLLLSAARVAMILLDVAPYYHQMLTGALLVLVIAIDPKQRAKLRWQ